MRILQIAPPWFPVPPGGYGGIEQVVANLVDGLETAGHDVTLLASGDSTAGTERLALYARAPSPMLGDAVTEIMHLLEAYLDESLQRFDVIHDHTLLGTILGAVATGPPVVHTLHGPWSSRSAYLYGRLSRRVHLVAISEDQASRAPRHVPLAGMVHNGIDVDRFPYVREKGDHLAFVGRANPEKGPDVAIEVGRRMGVPLIMALKVNEPEECQYWEQVLAPLVRGADVDVHRSVTPDEKNEIMGTASVVLFPIQWPEPFGLVPIEANACGTPVVAYANGAAPEVIADGSSGYCVAPDGLDAFCEAVERARSLSPEECRANAEDRFSADLMVERYVEIYERVAGVTRASGHHREGSPARVATATDLAGDRVELPHEPIQPLLGAGIRPTVTDRLELETDGVQVLEDGVGSHSVRVRDHH